ncbi:hypothetical protein [Alkalihalobacillus sp. 1P02AB]|uniref:hypothetical protein n=1 Tax=Alkalihalobacillus sp. 1P02AB TaxID=3132260 RepID=UPI0039A61EEF
MKRFFFFISISILLMSLGACNNTKDERLHVMAFSDELYENQDVLSELIEDENVQFTVYPTILERLIVELAGHDADILFVEESITEPMDPEGLISLDEVDGTRFVLRDEEYVAGLSLNEMFDGVVELEIKHMVAVPVYNERQTEALALVKKWHEEELPWS